MESLQSIEQEKILPSFATFIFLIVEMTRLYQIILRMEISVPKVCNNLLFC